MLSLGKVHLMTIITLKFQSSTLGYMIRHFYNCKIQKSSLLIMRACVRHPWHVTALGFYLQQPLPSLHMQLLEKEVGH